MNNSNNNRTERPKEFTMNQTASKLRAPLRASLLPLALALVLAGCASPAAIDRSQLPIAPTAFKESAVAVVAPTAAPQAQGQWWTVFADPVLDGLITKANGNNTSIQVAAARLAQARALAGQVDANRLPQIGMGAGATRQLNATTGNAAQTVLSLRALDAERELVRGTLLAYQNTVRLTEVRLREGDVAELDVTRVRSEAASTESEALALDQRRAVLEHALAVLVGEVASNFAIAPTTWSTALPAIPAGVPSTVLTRRPDIAAAQNTMHAAQARVGIAKAAWFPTFSLTANGGYAAPEVQDLFKLSTQAWGVGALLSLPIFDGGRRESGVQGANAELGIALANYRDQVLVAFRDVEDQLAALRLLAEQSEAHSRSVAYSSRATVLSGARYRNGFVSQLELLDAQRNELRNRRQALQVKAAQYAATVGLIRALGGGWA
jgi:multidrug efflux system outer membrane protein